MSYITSIYYKVVTCKEKLFMLDETCQVQTFRLQINRISRWKPLNTQQNQVCVQRVQRVELDRGAERNPTLYPRLVCPAAAAFSPLPRLLLLLLTISSI